MGKTLHIVCPHCGTWFVDGIKATNLVLTCKRCKTKITLSFDDNYIQIEIMRLRKSILYISCPCCGTKLAHGNGATDITLICPRCKLKTLVTFNDTTILFKICRTA